MGGDGGAFVMLIARNTLISNGTFLLRSGQSSCGSGSNGGSGTADNGVGGNGASNNAPNCIHSSGGAGGASIPSPGASGGIGGAGAGGMAVFASYNLNLSGANISVDGGTASTGGTIKVLYTNNLANGTYESGYAGLIVSNITDSFFQPDLTAEDIARAAMLTGLNASEVAGNFSYLQDHQVYIRIANGSQYKGRFDLFVRNGNKKWAFNYDATNASALPTFANITPVFYAWQRINLTTANITNDVSAFINGTYP
jgi:hypothetical protein